MSVLNSVIKKRSTENYEGLSRNTVSKFDYTLVECITEEDKSNFFLMIISQPRDRNYRGTSITNGYERIRDKIIEMGLLKDIDLGKVKWFDHYERNSREIHGEKRTQDITPVTFNAVGNVEFEKRMLAKEFRELYQFDIEEDLSYF